MHFWAASTLTSFFDKLWNKFTEYEYFRASDKGSDQKAVNTQSPRSVTEESFTPREVASVSKEIDTELDKYITALVQKIRRIFFYPGIIYWAFPFIDLRSYWNDSLKERRYLDLMHLSAKLPDICRLYLIAKD